ncbi:MAG: HAMP domain-containing histidine kinase [Chitinophagaceae bacterium]|nr:HAMP domain-containing histidine kinase [Chitinophagaceae bacterium]
MTIRSKTLRLALLLSTILVAIIIIVQLFWLQKIYRYEEKQFNINVSKSIKSLYAKMELVNDVSDIVQKVIENPKPDLYLVRIDCTPNLPVLWTNLKEELTDFDVFTDCKAAVYNKDEKKIVGEEYIDLADSYHSPINQDLVPALNRDYSYIELFFPHRGQYIIKQMAFWFGSSALLLLVLIGLSASIFYLYRQKFLNETQKDFVNNFTHEFKTPLSVIKIAADVLKQEDITQHPERLKNYASIIAQQTSHLQSQVQRLLEIAYTDRTSLSLEREKIDFVELMQQALDDLQPLIAEKNAYVHLYKPQQPYIINVDKAYILLALINLIENAVKYALQPKIDITFLEEANWYNIQITDNGIGIDAKYHKKIFDRFFRVPSGEIHNAKGFGLGLSFVKKVIDAHGGSITVKSEPQKGSTFIIALPKN